MSTRKQLLTACNNGDLDTVKSLLTSSDYDPEIRDKRGYTPLHIACQKGYLPLVRFLVQEKGWDVNCQAKDGSTPLHYVCYNRALNIIKFLLQQRCDTTVQNKRGQSPQTIPLDNKYGDVLLHIACHWGDVDIIKLLLQQRCDTRVQNKRGLSPQTIPLNEDGDLLFHIACLWGDVDVIKFLLQQRCDTRVQNKRGQSPQTIPLNTNGDLLLHIACQWGDVDIIKFLLQQRCDTTVQNKRGQSPQTIPLDLDGNFLIHFACKWGDVGIIKFLLQQRCDTRVQNKRGQSPQTIPLNEDGNLLLHIACQWGDVVIVRYLVCEQHCHMNVQNEKGDSLLHVACQGSNLDIVKYLITEQHRNVNVQNKNGDSLLHVACKVKSNLDIVKYLITEQHCDVNVQNKKGTSPLHIACYNKTLNTIKFLLQQRCDTRVQNMMGQSPQTIPLNEDGDLLLHIACQWGDVDIVRYLVCEQHCNMNVQKMNGDTLLHVACQGSNLDIVKYLITEQHCDVNARNKNGDSLLHVTCQGSNLDIVKYLITEQHCDVNARNKNGDSLLHVTCQGSNLDIVKYLITEQHCDVNARNKNGDSPLHTACIYKKSLDIIKFLLQQEGDTRVQNKRGQSPQTIPFNDNGDLLLHIACQWGDVDIIKFLLQQKCDTWVQNKRGQSPQTIPLDWDGDFLIHFACRWGDVDIIKFLLQQRCDTKVKNKRGQSPQTIPLNEDGDLLLHIACQWGDVDIVRYLVCEQHCNMNVQNKNGDSLLHVTCQGSNLDIVKYLITEQHCDVNARNKNGDSPLHTACIYKKSLDIIKFLLQQRCDTKVKNKRGQSPQTIPLNDNGDLLLHVACQWGDVDIIKFLLQQRCDTKVKNKRGQIPQTISLNDNGDLLLHVASQWGDVDIVRYLVCEQQCDVNVQNNKGRSPLHIAIVSCQPSTALYLLQHEQCDRILPDSDGNTPLHLACMNVDGATGMLQVARLLLSSIDPSCVNNAGQTPVELTVNYQLIQDISHITECKTKYSIQTYVKMFFIGNPSTGKSTLVKAIYSEKSWLWKLLPRWFSRVRNVPIRTAGIIPISFRSKKFGNTVLYDMAGQYEYYSSHAAVIENTVLSSPPAFIVVVDLSESDDKIMEKLRYWWSFIDNHAARSIVPPHVILIGSHADVVEVSGASVQEKMSTISSALRGLSSSFHFVGQVALDCRDPVSSELDQFCSLVDRSCTTLRQTADIDLRCHVAYSFLLGKFEGTVTCTVSEIAAQITATDTLLPRNPDELALLLSSLSDKGLVLLIKASGSIEESWVILQKQYLLNEFNGTIFAPENFREHRDFARSTGVVSFSHIKQEFPQYDPAMIVGFLTHLEFCFKIDDPGTIKRIEDEAPKDETSLDLLDEYYFFPALVSVDTPHQVWQEDDSMQHQCGWYYRCHPDQFLTSRFLHVLILRLAFSFALGLDKYHPSQRAPVLCRRCSVWKHGIGWLQDGIETVVEVGLQCQWVNVMMRCLKGKEVKCVQLRSAVIQEIKNARNELCKAVKTTEMVIRPSDVHYLFSGKEVSLYSLTDIANAIAKKDTHVVDQQSYDSKTLIPLCDLVIFDPYLSVGPELLNELFHQDNSDNVVSETFLDHLASCIHPQMSLFQEVVDPQPAMRYQKEIEKESLPASKCLVLLQWLLRKLKDPTYGNFHKELDRFSIFCGRNPMDVADAKVVASVQHMKLGPSRSDPDRVQHTQPEASEHTGNTPAVYTTKELTVKDLDCIPEETPILKDLTNLPIPSWYSLGIQLGVPPSKLNNIQATNGYLPDAVERSTVSMFQWWLDNDGSPTYRSLVKGLMAAGMTDAVRIIHNRYAAPPS